MESIVGYRSSGLHKKAAKVLMSIQCKVCNDYIWRNMICFANLSWAALIIVRFLNLQRNLMFISLKVVDILDQLYLSVSGNWSLFGGKVILKESWRAGSQWGSKWGRGKGVEMRRSEQDNKARKEEWEEYNEVIDMEDEKVK